VKIANGFLAKRCVFRASFSPHLIPLPQGEEDTGGCLWE
jgi:hypothetical protein